MKNPWLTVSEEGQARSAKKQMFVVFFDVRGVILTHAVSLGQTINAAYYTKVILLHVNFYVLFFHYYTIDDFKLPGA